MSSGIRTGVLRSGGATPVSVECDMTNGLPGILIVGLGNKAIDEARERVRSAIRNSTLNLPRRRLIINLAPADLPKDGSCLDLAIALAVLTKSGQVAPESLEHTWVAAELGLSGEIRPIPGVLAHALSAKEAGCQTLITSAANAAQAALVPGLHVIGARSLRDLYDHLTRVHILTPTECKLQQLETRHGPRLEQLYGQESAKRALVVAAAGQHNLLMHGPPGTGKTMLAQCLGRILPPLSPELLLEVTKLQSIADPTYEPTLQPPVRSPHHSASLPALVGGGQPIRPGEISLAHGGVLFLDELAEFPRSVVESLRQPLEDGQIQIVRAHDLAQLPARFLLIATTNPCPCGFAGDERQICRCAPIQLSRYRQRLSGPLMDRIDLHVRVERVRSDQLLSDDNSTQTNHLTSSEAASLVVATRDKQLERNPNSQLNSELSLAEIKRRRWLTSDAKQLLIQASDQWHLSGRSQLRIIRVSRTIADLARSESIEQEHLAEALSYRSRLEVDP